MLSTDPIADMLSRIRNAAMIKSSTVTVPYSKSKRAVLQVLSDAGWIGAVDVQGTPARLMTVALKYDDRGDSLIHMVRKISTPGRRVYVGHAEIPVVANNFGVAVISTSQGMMTNREARRRKLGGEVICEVQ